MNYIILFLKAKCKRAAKRALTQKSKAPSFARECLINAFVFLLQRPHSDGAGHLAGSQTTGAGINMGGLAVHHCLHTLHIGLPGPVGPSVRVGHSDPERNTLTADIAFCHSSAPPLAFFPISVDRQRLPPGYMH